MAKGTESKNIIFAKLQEVFPDTFWEDQGKILRIPLDENGVRVEIKVTLTAAKTNLGEEKNVIDSNSEISFSTGGSEKVTIEPTQEEKATISALIASLGL